MIFISHLHIRPARPRGRFLPRTQPRFTSDSRESPRLIRCLSSVWPAWYLLPGTPVGYGAANTQWLWYRRWSYLFSAAARRLWRYVGFKTLTPRCRDSTGCPLRTQTHPTSFLPPIGVDEHPYDSDRRSLEKNLVCPVMFSQRCGRHRRCQSLWVWHSERWWNSPWMLSGMRFRAISHPSNGGGLSRLRCPTWMCATRARDWWGQDSDQ